MRTFGHEFACKFIVVLFCIWTCTGPACGRLENRELATCFREDVQLFARCGKESFAFRLDE